MQKVKFFDLFEYTQLHISRNKKKIPYWFFCRTFSSVLSERKKKDVEFKEKINKLLFNETILYFTLKV